MTNLEHRQQAETLLRAAAAALNASEQARMVQTYDNPLQLEADQRAIELTIRMAHAHALLTRP